MGKHKKDIALDRLRRLFCAAIMLLPFAAGGAPEVDAQARPADLPSVETLENWLEVVDTADELSEEEKAQTAEFLKLSINRLQAATAVRHLSRQYAAALTDAPPEQARLEALSASFENIGIPAGLSAAPLSEIEVQLNQELNEQTALRSRLAQLDADVKAEKSYDIQATIEEVTQQGLATRPEADSAAASEAQRVLEAATDYLQQTRLEMLDQRQRSRGARLSLWGAERNLLEKQIAASEIRSAELQALIADQRQSDAQRMAARATATLESPSEEPQGIRDLARDVVERSEELGALAADHQKTLIDRDMTQRERQQLERKYGSLSEQLDIAQLESSPEFGAALRGLRDQLTSAEKTGDLLREHEQTLTRSRLAQFRIDALREPEVRLDFERVVAKLRLDPDVTITPEREQLIRELVAERDGLLEQLSVDYASHIDDLASATAQRRAFIGQSQEYAERLDQHLLWMPSASAMGLQTLAALGSSLGWLMSPTAWRDVVAHALERIKRFPLVVLLGGLLLLALLTKRPRLVQALTGMQGQVGKVQLDKLSLTIKAVLITALLAVPGPLAMLFVAALVGRPGGFSAGLAFALAYTSVVYLILEFVLQTLRRNGVVELHFNWRRTTIATLKANLPWFMALFIPAVGVNLLVEAQGTAVVRDSLGRIAFVAATLVLAVFAYRVFNPRRGILANAGASTTNPFIHYGVFTLLIALPVVVAGLSIYGYHYSAVQIDSHLLQSFLVVIVATGLFSFFQRSFAISTRRLALRRIRAKRAAAIAQAKDREAASAAGEGVPTALDLEEVDLQTISDHTRTLLWMAVVVFGGLALAGIWSDLLPAVQPLENVKFWSVTESVDGVPLSVAVTLLDVLTAISVGVITFLAARNLPGLLEIAVLRRTSIEAGTSYAITTVSVYVLAITGSLIALQLLGAQWSKLQWLVAALSVGLGFGLQEIVANFVSGIVILFERPIRIGDTVTVGDQWGTVSKIRIRATTIVDWDRRELIIPNKTFITERLVNWTLTDPITRTTVSVGVAYGSDVALVEKLLLEIAKDNSMVLDDPRPTVLFRQFGDSTLDFDLRVFVRGIHDLVPATHELHVAIDRVFREHGVEIAFPQRDLHFDARPIEVRLVDPDVPGAEA